MKAQIRGTEIFFDISGMQVAPADNEFRERPVVFMLHGGPGGDHQRFKIHSIELQEVAQLVFIDNRGCGRSKKTKMEDYTCENNIEDIEALRQYLGLKKICLLGTSYGGIVAQGYAIRYPSHLEKLVLVATAPSYHFKEEAKKEISKKGSIEQITFCDHLWNGTFTSPEHVADFFSLMSGVYSKKQKDSSAINKTSTWSYEALNHGFRTFLSHFDYREDLKRITCPTLVLAGDEDWICSMAQARVIAQQIPNAQLRIFDDCGHIIAVDAHDQYIATVKDFIMK